MADVNPLYLKVLDACKSRGGEPLYPKPFSISEGIDRSALDEALDHLRIHGLIQLTEWVKDLGQGYTLTPDGERILANPLLLNRPLPKPRPLRRDPTTTYDRGEQIRDSLLEPARPIVTPILLAANIVVFGLGWYQASRQNIGHAYMNPAAAEGLDLHTLTALQAEMGSLQPARVEVGQWWRLLSYAFLHAGLAHILLNMFFLYSFGPVLESLWGWWRYTILYAIGAAGGGAAVYLAQQAAVGASGALCGLFASLGVWLFMSRSHLPEETFMRLRSHFVVNTFILLAISFVPGVSWAGHLGGAVAGGLVSVALHWNRFGSRAFRWLGLAGMALVPAAIAAIVYLPYSELRERSSFQHLVHQSETVGDRLWDFQLAHGAKLIAKGPRLGNDQEAALQEIDAIVVELGALLDRVETRTYQTESIQKALPALAARIKPCLALAEGYQRALAQPESWNDAAREKLRTLAVEFSVMRRFPGFHEP